MHSGTLEYESGSEEDDVGEADPAFLAALEAENESMFASVSDELESVK